MNVKNHRDYGTVTMETFRVLAQAVVTMFTPFRPKGKTPGVGAAPEHVDASEMDEGNNKHPPEAAGGSGAMDNGNSEDRRPGRRSVKAPEPNQETKDSAGPGEVYEGLNRETDNQELESEPRAEEEGDMEMLFDTAVERYVDPLRSSVQRSIWVSTIGMKLPKNRAMFSTFSSAAGSKVSFDCLRRVMGASATVTAPFSDFAVDQDGAGPVAGLLIGDPFVAPVALTKQGKGVSAPFATTRPPPDESGDDEKKVDGALLSLQYKKVEASGSDVEASDSDVEANGSDVEASDSDVEASEEDVESLDEGGHSCEEVNRADASDAICGFCGEVGTCQTDLEKQGKR